MEDGATFETMATKTKKIDWQPACPAGRLAPAPESKDHIKINEQYELFIGGKWVKPKSGTRSTGSGEPYFDTINPEVHCETGR